MCLQCMTDAEVIVQDIIPGYSLMQAQKDYGGIWDKDEYAMVVSNDPDFVIRGTPIRDPWDGLTDEEMSESSEELMDRWHEFMAWVDENLIELSPNMGYSLIKACEKAGYDIEEDGDVVYWLLNYIATKLESNDESKTLPSESDSKHTG